MLKPKYGNITESVSDFHRMLDGMNRVQPVEHSSYDALDALVREEQDLERLEKAIEHVENVIAGSGLGISEADRRELGNQYGEAANRYTRGANRANQQADMAKKRGENPALQDKYKEVARRLRRKGQEYKDKKRQLSDSKQTIVAESRDIAVNSQYRSGDSALERFRVLAGLEEQTAMPRDAGIFGSTRHNANYDEMAGQSIKKELSEGDEYGDDEPARTQAMTHHWRAGDAARERGDKKGAKKHAKSSRKLFSTQTKVRAKRWKAEKKAEKLKSKQESFDLEEGGGSRRTKSDRQMAKLGRYTRHKEVDLKNPEVKTVLKHMYRPRRKPEDSLARDSRNAKKMREHPAAMRKDTADYYARKHDVGRSELAGPNPKLPKDPKKKQESWDLEEGGGSRRSKEARQGKHYEKFAPAHLYTKSDQRDKKNMHKSWQTGDIDRRAMSLNLRKKGGHPMGPPDPKATGLQKGSVARSMLHTAHQKRLEKKRK